MFLTTEYFISVEYLQDSRFSFLAFLFFSQPPVNQFNPQNKYSSQFTEFMTFLSERGPVCEDYLSSEIKTPRHVKEFVKLVFNYATSNSSFCLISQLQAICFLLIKNTFYIRCSLWKVPWITCRYSLSERWVSLNLVVFVLTFLLSL